MIDLGRVSQETKSMEQGIQKEMPVSPLYRVME